MAILHFVAGKAGAGKTTLARRLASSTPAVLICEDAWLTALAEPIRDLPQYVAAAGRIRAVVAPLAIDLLKLGTSVVFDFGGNTITDRRWVRSIFEAASADHLLHYIRADDHTCLRRVEERNVTRPEGVFFGAVSAEQVAAVNRFFSPPSADEGFKIMRHGDSE